MVALLRQYPGEAKCLSCQWKYEGPTYQVGEKVREHWLSTAVLVPRMDSDHQPYERLEGHPIYAYYGGEIPPDPREGKEAR